MTKGLTGNAMTEKSGTTNSMARKRPAYKPKQIKCKGCGAALSVKDEHSEFIVCEYCGSQLDISEAEQRVLGKNPPGKPDFTFEIGESWRQKGARFECIGRMAFVEDGDFTDMTLVYLFYSPRMGSMWIGEYQGTFSMTRPCHVMPLGSGLGKKRGETLETWDKRKWVCEGSGVYELYYVDGALPWVATRGDKVEYAEFAAEDGSGHIYEIERIKGEIEYGTGKRLDTRTVRSATGRKDIEDQPRPLIKGASVDAAVQRGWYTRTMIIVGVCFVFNALFAIWTWTAGTKVLKQYVGPKELTQGFFCDPFRLKGNNSAVRIEFNAKIDNAWMSVEAMLVKDEGDDRKLLVHKEYANIEYYEGVEGGEVWTEGSRHEAIMVRVPDPGTYRVFLRAVSAKGNTPDSERAMHGLLITVTDGAQPRIWAVSAMILCGLMLLLTFKLYMNWKADDD